MNNRFNPPEALTVVIPAFNEAENIGFVVESILKLGQEHGWEILVIDDGSIDGTAAEVEHYADGVNLKLICHVQNKGYGAALKTGIREAKNQLVATMDADGQHDPNELLKLIAVADRFDMVVGQRTRLIHSLLWRMPGKWLLGLMANYLTRRTIPDLNSGLRIVRRDVALKYMHLCPSGFSFSITFTMALLSRGYTVAYVPIEVKRRIGKSTVSITTGLETVILILRIATLFEPLRIFVPASMLIAMMGIVWGIPYALAGRGISIGSMLAIVTSILLFGLGLLCDQISQLRLERFE